MRHFVPLFALSAVVLTVRADAPKGGKPLFNGKDTTGWKLRDPNAAARAKWSAVSSWRRTNRSA